MRPRLPPTASNAPRAAEASSPTDAIAEASENVPEEDIIRACIVGDLGQLQRWALRGVRVQSAEPLLQAAGRGHLDVMRCLVSELHADANQQNEAGVTPLVIGVDVDKTRLRDGVTALHLAAQRGDLAMVRVLFKELGADVNLATHEGLTPLILASTSKHKKIVKLLLKTGADPQASVLLNGASYTELLVCRSLGALPSWRSIWRPRCTSPIPDAVARGSRSARGASRRGTVSRCASWLIGRHTRSSVRRSKPRLVRESEMYSWEGRLPHHLRIFLSASNNTSHGRVLGVLLRCGLSIAAPGSIPGAPALFS